MKATAFAYAYLLMSFTLPYRRIIHGGWDSDSIFANFFQVHVYFPIFAMGVVGVVLYSNTVAKRLNYISRPPIVNKVGVSLLCICIVLTILQIGGLWWTWLTVGVHIATIILVVNYLKNENYHIHALILGIGLISLGAGIWEIAYQVGYHRYVDPDYIDITHLLGQVSFVLPLIVGGLGLTTFYAIALKVRPRITPITVVLLVAHLVAWVLWVRMGFWVDIWYSWEEGIWRYSDSNYLQMFIYRSSKATLALILASLYFRRRQRESLVRVPSHSHMDSHFHGNNVVPRGDLVEKSTH